MEAALLHKTNFKNHIEAFIYEKEPFNCLFLGKKSKHLYTMLR